MQLVLQGKRASRYIGTGKRRVGALRAFGAKYVNSLVPVPAGTIVVQVLGDIDRVFITVSDPYLLLDCPVANPTLPPGTVGYINFEGGVTGETFEPSGYDARAVVDPVQFTGLNKYVCAGENALTAYSLSDDSLFPVTYISKINTLTGKASYIFGYNLFKPGNVGSQPVLAIVTAGHIGPGTELNTYCAFGTHLYDIDTSPSAPPAPNNYKSKFPYVAMVRVNKDDPDISTESYAIWPLTSINSGRLDRVPQAMSLISAGKDRVAWMQRYSYADPEHPDPIPQDYPEIVVFNAATASFTRTDLRTILNGSVEDPDELIINQFAHLGYCGNGVMIAALSYPDPAAPTAGHVIARSTDYGTTWSVLTHKITPNFRSFEDPFFTNEHALVSYAPGVIWLYTIRDADSVIELHYSEDYGVTWSITTVDPLVDALPKYLGAVAPVYNKRKRGTAYCVTRYSADKTEVFIDTFDSFSPTANKLSTEQIPVKLSPTDNFPTYAAFFDKNAPMMPGHPGELGDANAE